MDISFKIENWRFNYRVCALILDGGKVLALRDERSPYYYLPGGRVKLGEKAEDAVLRELKEELGIDAEIVRPVFLAQSFFTEDVTREDFHELCIYFLIDASKTDLFSRGGSFTINERHHRLEFEWLDINALEEMYFYPIFLKIRLRALPEELELITAKE